MSLNNQKTSFFKDVVSHITFIVGWDKEHSGVFSPPPLSASFLQSSSLPFYTQIQCIRDKSQGTQYMFMDELHLQIWPWNHLALSRTHLVERVSLFFFGVRVPLCGQMCSLQQTCARWNVLSMHEARRSGLSAVVTAPFLWNEGMSKRERFSPFLYSIMHSARLIL